MKNTQRKIVSASGARKRRSRWKTSLTWVSTNSTTISTKAWPLPGTPEVALRAAAQKRPSASTPVSTDMKIVSTCQVQNPSPTLRWVRWWVMYSVLFAGPCPAMISPQLRTFVSCSARPRGPPQTSSRRRSPRRPRAAATASTFGDRNATTSRATVKRDLHDPAGEEAPGHPLRARSLAVPQHRERHQRRRRDTDPGPEQRRRARTGPPHGEAGGRNDRPEQPLPEHDAQSHVAAPAGSPRCSRPHTIVRATKKPRHVPGASGHGWRFDPLPGQAVLHCTASGRPQIIPGLFALLQCSKGANGAIGLRLTRMAAVFRGMHGCAVHRRRCACRRHLRLALSVPVTTLL